MHTTIQVKKENGHEYIIEKTYASNGGLLVVDKVSTLSGHKERTWFDTDTGFQTSQARFDKYGQRYY
jgi:hypothetical protein